MASLSDTFKAYASMEGDERLELRLFRLLCLTATLLSIFVVMPANHLHRLSPWINVVTGAFAMATLLLAWEAGRGRHHIKSLFFLFLTVLILVWFPNGGSQGSIGYFFFILFLYAALFFRAGLRWLMLATAAVVNILLLVSELYFPQWLVAYHTPYHRSGDLVVSIAVTALCCSLIIWTLLTRYDREQQRLVVLNKELLGNAVERAEVERVLFQNRELLRSVIDGSNDAIFVKDIGGRYILFNAAAEEVTGKPVEEVLGKDDTFLFPGDEARVIMEQDRQVLAGSGTVCCETRVTDAKGMPLLREVTKGPVHDGHGKIIGLFGISRDITESRRMAQELRMLNEELERRVVERTALLQAAMQEQESFSYSVSHDLRGPLRHINSYTAIIQEDFGSHLPPEALRYLERVRESSRRMGNLIDDLLELSRIGRSELVKVPVNLTELAEEIGAKLREVDPARRVELIVEPGLLAHGDRVLLEQMLENLIGNAWKYSSPRECARIESGKGVFGEREAFLVRDNGVGFDMAYRDKLFGAFQRLHGSEFEGTGIGLATVKRIVERHQGSVWAHSEIDQGATVYFTLPQP